MVLAFENGNYVQTYEGHLENKNTIKSTRNDFKKLQFIKREYGSKVKKLCKKVRDQIVWKQVEDTALGLL